MEETGSPSPFLAKYLSAYEKDPKSRVFAPLAESYRKSGYVEKALEILKEGIKVHPSYVLGYFGLANCYSDLGEFSQSYSILRPLIDNNRDNLSLQKLFAETCLKLEYEEEALDTYKYLLFLNPKDKEVGSKVSELERSLGERKFQEKELEEEESLSFNEQKLKPHENDFGTDIDEWIQVDLGGQIFDEDENSQDQWNLTSLSDVSSESNEINEEDKLIFEEEEHELELDDKPDNPVITHTLVDLYCSQGYYDKAVEILEKILELNPNDENTRLKLEQTREQYGIKEEAVVELSEEQDFELEIDGSIENFGSIESGYQEEVEEVGDIGEFPSSLETDSEELYKDALSTSAIEEGFEKIAEREGSHLEDKMNKFLSRIKDRAEQKRS